MVAQAKGKISWRSIRRWLDAALRKHSEVTLAYDDRQGKESVSLDVEYSDGTFRALFVSVRSAREVRNIIRFATKYFEHRGYRVAHVQALGYYVFAPDSCEVV